MSEPQNGKGIFRLAPPDFDAPREVPKLRIKVRAIRDLEPSCKVIYDSLCEDGFHKFAVAPGIIRRAKTAVGHACALSSATVLRAARELERRQLVYSKVVWEGLGEMTYWYIVGWASQHELQPVYDEATGRMMRVAARPKRERNSKGKFLKKDEKTAINAEMTGTHGQSYPPARTELAIGMDRTSHRHGQSYPPDGKASPHLPLTVSTPMDNLVHRDRSKQPQTKNVSSLTLDPLREGQPPQGGIKNGEIGKEAADRDWQDWQNDVKKEFPRELQARLASLEKQAGPLVARKISFLRKKLDLPEKPNPDPKSARRVAVPPAPLSAEEIQAGKAYLAEIGLTKGAAAAALAKARAQ